jgi:hypothetical protein
MNQTVSIRAVVSVTHESSRKDTTGDDGGWRAKAIAIKIAKPLWGVGGGVIVDDAIAIVVFSVTILEAKGAAERVEVVAIKAVAHMAFGHIAGIDHDIGIAESVAVGIKKPLVWVEGIITIDLSVAVVIDAVAKLIRIGVDLWVCVVAITAPANAVGRARTGLEASTFVAKPVVVQVEEISAHQTFVDLTIAVVVDTITELGGGRVDIWIAIVAVHISGMTVGVSIYWRIIAIRHTRVG